MDARILLSRAVEVIPLSVELWLALARLETPDKAKAVLNKARKAVPTSHEIWIAAGRLLEQEAYASHKPEDELNKALEAVDKTIEAGVRELRRHQVLLTREQWLKEAEKCESEGSLRTCEAIIKATIAMDVEEEDRLDTWVSDAESAEAKSNVGTARAILAYALRVFPDKRSLWRKAADLEKAHGTRSVLFMLRSNWIFTGILDIGSHLMLFLPEPFITVLKPKCCGSCGPRRSGWPEMFLLPVKCLRKPSWPTQKANRSGWLLSNWRLRMASWELLESYWSVPGQSQILNGQVLYVFCGDCLRLTCFFYIN